MTYVAFERIENIHIQYISIIFNINNNNNFVFVWMEWKFDSSSQPLSLSVCLYSVWWLDKTQFITEPSFSYRLFSFLMLIRLSQLSHWYVLVLVGNITKNVVQLNRLLHHEHLCLKAVWLPFRVVWVWVFMCAHRW